MAPTAVTSPVFTMGTEQAGLENMHVLESKLPQVSSKSDEPGAEDLKRDIMDLQPGLSKPQRAELSDRKSVV